MPPHNKEIFREVDGWYTVKIVPTFLELAHLIPENVGVALIHEFETEQPEKAKEVKGFVTFPSGERFEIRYNGTKVNFDIYFSKTLSMPFFQNPVDALNRFSDKTRPFYQAGWRAEKMSASAIEVRMPSMQKAYQIEYAQGSSSNSRFVFWQIRNIVDLKKSSVG
jgi:hypothetical protein